ncbi:hypothetical protein MTR67_035254 [Solanum verrucosum]|uniref:Uncharacterized protein n=1 Tax=Solanum verrucosum TaxID=315347 RepID=A0AAF0ZM53_SOLVR|nr:hypothetical protein MTR67_035254 [Solanum verrucosum]
MALERLSQDISYDI